MRPRLLMFVVAGLLAGGCGGDSRDQSPAQRLESKQLRPLAQQLRPVAQRVVDRLWRAVLSTDSALPLFYDESVLRAIGPSELSAVLYAPGPQFAVRPRVISVQRSPLGLVVFTESRPDDVAPIRASYLLRKVGVQWKILYDSNLAQSLDRLMGTASQLRDPAALTAQRVATVDADLRLREIALPKALRGRQGRSRERGLGPLLRRNYLRRPSVQPPPDSG